MMRNDSKIISNMFTLLIMISCAIAFFTVIKQYNVVSLLFAISFVVIFCRIFMLYKSCSMNIAFILLIGVTVVNVIINCLVNDGEFSVMYMRKLVMFLCFCFLQYYAAFSEYKFSPRTICLIEKIPVLVGVFFVVSYYLFGNTERIAGGIILGFSNPNFTGMWLFHFFLYGFYFMYNNLKKNKWCLLYIPFIVAIINLIIESLTRSCLISILIFAVLIFWTGILKRKINKIILFVIVFFPIIYMIIYMNVVNSEWFENMFSFVISEGKSLKSRLYIWSRSLKIFYKSPILGDYFGISSGTGQSQLHNTHLDILCSYGIVTLVLYIKLLFDVILKTYDNVKNISNNILFCAFCATIIQGSFEAAIVSGSMGLNYLTIGFLVLINRKDTKNV